MNTYGLSYMKLFYMAFADTTRLRIVNLIRNGEVYVGCFTEVLGVSQPKISRHLAYLRGAGIVKARREGKRMHYSIAELEQDGGKSVLNEILSWLDDQDESRMDIDKYRQLYGTPEILKPKSTTATSPKPEIFADPIDKYRHSAHNELDEFLL